MFSLINTYTLLLNYSQSSKKGRFGNTATNIYESTNFVGKRGSESDTVMHKLIAIKHRNKICRFTILGPRKVN